MSRSILVSRQILSTANAGFTLLELLLVVTIIGVLAALVVPRFVGRTQQARIAGARQDIASLSTALDIFEQDVGRYPTADEGLRALVEAASDLQGWQGPYLKTDSIPLDPWGNEYVYRYPSELSQHKTLYDLVSGGPDGQIGGDDDITNHDARLEGSGTSSGLRR